MPKRKYDYFKLDINKMSKKELQDYSRYLNKKAKNQYKKIKESGLKKFLSGSKKYNKTSFNNIKQKKLSDKVFENKLRKRIEKTRQYLDNESSTLKGAKKILSNFEKKTGIDIETLRPKERKTFFDIFTQIKEIGLNNVIKDKKEYYKLIEKYSKIMSKQLSDTDRINSFNDLVSDIDSIYQEEQQAQDNMRNRVIQSDFDSVEFTNPYDDLDDEDEEY